MKSRQADPGADQQAILLRYKILLQFPGQQQAVVAGKERGKEMGHSVGWTTNMESLILEWPNKREEDPIVKKGTGHCP